MQIEGAHALVTGGASGLGAATARRLHAAGAHVVIADLADEHGEALASELGERAAFLHTDVTDEASLGAAVDAARDGGELRIAISCAGIGHVERTLSRDGAPHAFDPYERVLRVNLFGTFNLIRLAAAGMTDNTPDEDGGRGVLVLTASVAAFDGQIGQIAYSASKGGVVGMTLPAARDLSKVGVRVCTIAPGVMDTPLMRSLPEPARLALEATVPHPSRLGLPDEYAQLAQSIVENQYLNGETIRLDASLRMAPK